jgi:hypothetical protein
MPNPNKASGVAFLENLAEGKVEASIDEEAPQEVLHFLFSGCWYVPLSNAQPPPAIVLNASGGRTERKGLQYHSHHDTQKVPTRPATNKESRSASL